MGRLPLLQRTVLPRYSFSWNTHGLLTISLILVGMSLALPPTMNSYRHWIFALVFTTFCSLTFVRAANAQSRVPTPPSSLSTADLRGELGLGYSPTTRMMGGNALFTGRYHWLEAGLSLARYEEVFGGSQTNITGVAGFVYQIPVGLRLEFLGEIGNSSHRNIKSRCAQIFSSSDCHHGVSADTFVYGARAKANWSFFRTSKTHLLVGTEVSVMNSPKSTTYFLQNGLNQDAITIGGPSGTLLFTMGLARDF
jgi:hypothetical protein